MARPTSPLEGRALSGQSYTIFRTETFQDKVWQGPSHMSAPAVCSCCSEQISGKAKTRNYPAARLLLKAGEACLLIPRAAARAGWVPTLNQHSGWAKKMTYFYLIYSLTNVALSLIWIKG